MKSILQQASNVLKAVEKAWIAIGQPTEFSVKILEKGEKGLLGLTKKSAIISLSYNPRVLSQKNVTRKEKSKITTEKKREKVVSQPPKNKIKKIEPKRKQVFWINDYISDISVWLKEILVAANIKTSFKMQANRKMLNVNLSNIILKSPEEEKIFFVSVSYLLMQFLKKKYKKKLDGYHLILNSKRPKN